LSRVLKSYIFLIGIAGFIIIADQITKAIVRHYLPYQETWSPWEWLTPYARIVHWSNTGVAFGMFQGKGDIFKGLAIIVSIAILYYFPRVPVNEWSLRIALAMQLGGAVGNLLDRIFIGTVTDFISIGNFAVFNIADGSITVGVGILILGILIQDIQKAREKKAGKHQDVSSNHPDGETIS
jgi:signal peptidase II